ncbi:PKD domain-containing protein, partial [Bacteroidota bacterium]
NEFDKSTVIKNNDNTPNTPPGAPHNLRSIIGISEVVLSWNQALDPGGQNGGLSYNLRVGTSPGAFDIISPMSNLTTGHNYRVGMGNVQLNNQWSIKNLAAGTYYWSVQAIDQSFTGGTWAAEQSFTISVLFSDFKADTVCLGDKTRFLYERPSSNDSIIDWKWDFGDGNTSDIQYPFHKYARADTFNVRLVTTSSLYSDTIRKQVIVKPKPSVDFSADIVCQGIETSFLNSTDLNSLNIASWQWNFGDGATSPDENPGTHGYLSSGQYAAELIALADNGCADTSLNMVNVAAYPETAISVDGPIAFCDGDSVTLSVESDNKYTYQWLHKGNNIFLANSSNFEAKNRGTYSAKIINSLGNCITTSDEITISIYSLPIAPNISISGPTIFCNGDSLVLSVTNYSHYTYKWKQNEGAVGTDSNELIVKTSGKYFLEVTNAYDCAVASTNIVDVTVSEIPVVSNFSANGSTNICEGDSLVMGVPFNSSYSFQWIKDGNLILNSTSNEYAAKEEGSYQLRIANDNACFGYSSEMSVTVLPIPPSLPIVTGSSSAKKGLLNVDDLCVGDSVQLNIDTREGLTYKWHLDGSYIGIEGPGFAARTAGTYTAIIENEHKCTCETSNSIEINFSPAPQKPNLSNTGDFAVCSGDDQYLSITNYNADNQYTWILNGNITTQQGDRIIMEESGRYRVQVSNQYNCAALSEEASVSILGELFKPDVVFTAGSDNVCPNEEVILSVEDPIEALLFQWQKNGVALTGEYGHSYEVTADGLYTVKVSAQGCDNESEPIAVTYKSALPKPDILAIGPIFWYLSTSNDTATNYRWYYEKTLVQEGEEAIYIAGENLGTYYVEITDDYECYTSSDWIKIPENTIVGLEETIDPWENLKIYPNPTPGVFNIEMDNPVMGDLIIDIFGETGARVINIKFHKTTTQFLTQIDLSEQPAAVYLIGLMLEEYKTTRRLIVK